MATTKPKAKIIEDEVLEPYLIAVDSASFTLRKKVYTTDTTKYREEVEGYYTQLPNALHKVVKLKTWDNMKDKNTLLEYIKTIESIQKEVYSLKHE